MQIIKLKEVLIKTELGGFTIRNLIDASQFQKPIPFGLRAVGWFETEIEEWIMARVQSRDLLIAWYFSRVNY